MAECRIRNIQHAGKQSIEYSAGQIVTIRPNTEYAAFEIVTIRANTQYSTDRIQSLFQV